MLGTIRYIYNLCFQVEELVADEQNDFGAEALEGYQGFVRSYASHSHKEIFNVRDLDLNKVAKSFGF